MPKELDNITECIEKVVEAVPSIYDDGLKPATQESGKTLALIPRTINAALAPLRKWIAQKEYNIAETEKLLAQKLEKVSYEKIVTPEAYVAVPAIQAISYSMDSEILRNLYANLLAKSMNTDTKDMVHPAYVEVIKQLTSNDVQVLEEISSNHSFQVFDITACKYTTATSSLFDDPIEKYGYEGLTHITSINPDMVKLSIDNLSRLRLIEERFDLSMTVNEKMKSSHFYSDISTRLKQYITDSNWKYEENGHLLFLSTFGSYFHDICVNNP